MNPLARLAALTRDNDALAARLDEARAHIADARAYLESPGCRARFGEAHLERCRAKCSGIRAMLRANRIEALALLNGVDR